MSESEVKVSVIGAGPAGIAAAQQCIRDGIDDVVLFEKKRPGGLIYYANRIENFPGFIGKTGKTMAEELEYVITDYGIDLLDRGVKSIGREDGSFMIHDGRKEISSEYLVLATGTKPKPLGIDGEIYEPKLGDYSERNVVVIGGGDVAYDYALRLKDSGAEVTMIRRSEPKALKTLVEEVEAEGIPDIKDDLEGWKKTEEGYLLRCKGTELECDTVITAVGREPSLPEMDFSFSYIKYPMGATDVENLYAVGSLMLGVYRQASLSWGMGIAAGMHIASKIQKI
ncbi:MAG: NAD(P)/FAD-dependent oxidoreductase [Thermoplasmata archaeon]